MVGVFGAEIVVHFSPKDLGLSVEIFGTFSDSSDWIYGLSSGSLELSSWDCFGQS